MTRFTVTAIIDGDTFDVSPAWQWRGQQGTRVRPAGYDAPELGTEAGARARLYLEQLLRGNTVALDSPYRINRGRLVCEVYLGGRPLSDYVPR